MESYIKINNQGMYQCNYAIENSLSSVTHLILICNLSVTLGYRKVSDEYQKGIRR